MLDKQSPWVNYRHYRRYALLLTAVIVAVSLISHVVYADRASRAFRYLSEATITEVQARVRSRSQRGTYRITEPELMANIRDVFQPFVVGPSKERGVYPIQLTVQLFDADGHLATVDLYGRPNWEDIITVSRFSRVNRRRDFAVLLEDRQADVLALIRATEEGAKPIDGEEFWEP